MSYVRTYSTRADMIPADLKDFDPLLINCLRLCTPHGHEKHIINLINRQDFVKENVSQRYEDKKMHNLILRVGTFKESATIFSCHMDIVGEVSKAASDKGLVDLLTLMTPKNPTKMQEGMIYGAKPYRIKTDPSKEEYEIKYNATTLGADDKIGVYILLKMIEAKIPGLYMFHVGEECGCLGSNYLARAVPNFLKGYDRAIAFDRANYGDVIMAQRGSRCCSDEFANALADQLNEHMPPMQKFKKERGVYTDTASYMELIPECTNLSVGYFNQHGTGEHFDYWWLKDHLLPAILKLHYEELPTKRDPSKKESAYSSTTYYYGHNGYDDEGYSYSGGHKYQSNTYENQRPKDVNDWSNITVNTPYLQFPQWKPEMGFPKGASKAVLMKAISFYLNSLNYGEERTKFLEHITFLLEYKEILEDEIIVLRRQIETLSKGRGKITRKQKKAIKADLVKAAIKNLDAPAKEAINVPWKDPKEELKLLEAPKEKPLTTLNDIPDDEVEHLSPEEYREYVKKKTLKEIDVEGCKTIDLKKKFLRCLLEKGNEVQLFGDYMAIFARLSIGAKQWLALNEARTDDFTFKEIIKVNRLITNMATLMDAGSVSASSSLHDLLAEIDGYMTEHLEEEGWEIPSFSEWVNTQRAKNNSESLH